MGFSHSGWGLKISDEKLPSYEVPLFDSIGANEFIVDVVHDAVDFISTVDTPAPWELNIWYHTLNCGYRAKISGETDFPCIYGERVGLGRVYVKLPDGQLDFDKWCEGIKLGRSYVSDGRSHLIDFQVNEPAPGEAGSELKLDAPATVKVTAQVAAHLDPVISAEARSIHGRPLEQKPYWELECARLGETRKVPVEVIVNGQAVAQDRDQRRRQRRGCLVRRPDQEIKLGGAADLPVISHQPGLRHRRRQADPRVEEIGRMVRQVRRPVLVDRKSRPSGRPRKTRPKMPSTWPAKHTRRSWPNAMRINAGFAGLRPRRPPDRRSPILPSPGSSQVRRQTPTPPSPRPQVSNPTRAVNESKFGASPTPPSPRPP